MIKQEFDVSGAVSKKEKPDYTNKNDFTNITSIKPEVSSYDGSISFILASNNKDVGSITIEHRDWIYLIDLVKFMQEHNNWR